jgi:hypothetical protein
MLGIFVLLVFLVIVGLAGLGGYLFVAMKRRIDEDRALDDANSKRQGHALKATNGAFVKRLSHLWFDNKAEHKRMGAQFSIVDGKVAEVTESARNLGDATATIASNVEGARKRLNDQAATLGTEVSRLDSVDAELGNRIGDLEVFAPVVKRLTIDEDGINVCGFNSSASTMCKKIKFSEV